MTAKICFDSTGDIDIIRGSVTYQLDAMDTFDVTVAAQDVPNWRALQNQLCEVLVEDELLLTGYLHKRPSYARNRDEVLVLSLQGRSVLHELACIPAIQTDVAHFQDQLVVDILNVLIAFAPNWSIDFINLPNNTETTTIDLRSKKTLFGQLVAAVEATPKVFMRMGEINGANRTIQVGEFNDLTTYWENDNNNSSISLSHEGSGCFNYVIAKGELSADQPVTLENALDDPRTAASDYWSAGFQIIQSPSTGQYALYNINSDCACGQAEKFSLVKTQNDAVPTAQEVSEAGYALYLKAVRYLLENQETEVYNINIWRNKRPLIGDRIELRGDLQEPVKSTFPHIQNQEFVVVEELDGDYRMVQVQSNFESGRTTPNMFYLTDTVINYEIKATNNDNALRTLLNTEIALYEELENTTEADLAQASNPVFPPFIDSVTHNDPTDPADCLSPGGVDGKLYTFPTPPIPTGAASAQVFFSADYPAVVFDIVQPGDENNDLILCVGNARDANDAWGLNLPANAEDIAIRAIWTFSQ